MKFIPKTDVSTGHIYLILKSYFNILTLSEVALWNSVWVFLWLKHSFNGKLILDWNKISFVSLVYR